MAKYKMQVIAELEFSAKNDADAFSIARGGNYEGKRKTMVVKEQCDSYVFQLVNLETGEVTTDYDNGFEQIESE